MVFSSENMPLATPSASARSIEAPAEPAAPKAMRANFSRAEACRALLPISSRAKVRIDSSWSSSRTSSPFTIAPTGLITSWQTREQSRAARSRPSRCRVGEVGEDMVRSGRADLRCGRLRVGAPIEAAGSGRPAPGRPVLGRPCGDRVARGGPARPAGRTGRSVAGGDGGRRRTDGLKSVTGSDGGRAAPIPDPHSPGSAQPRTRPAQDPRVPARGAGHGRPGRLRCRPRRAREDAA